MSALAVIAMTPPMALLEKTGRKRDPGRYWLADKGVTSRTGLLSTQSGLSENTLLFNLEQRSLHQLHRRNRNRLHGIRRAFDGCAGYAGVDFIASDAAGHAIALTDALTANDATPLIALIGATIAIIILAIAGIVSAVGDTGLTAIDNTPIHARRLALCAADAFTTDCTDREEVLIGGAIAVGVLAIADIGTILWLARLANADLITIQATGHAIAPTDALTANDAAALVAHRCGHRNRHLGHCTSCHRGWGHRARLLVMRPSTRSLALCAADAFTTDYAHREEVLIGRAIAVGVLAIADIRAILWLASWQPLPLHRSRSASHHHVDRCLRHA